MNRRLLRSAFAVIALSAGVAACGGGGGSGDKAASAADLKVLTDAIAKTSDAGAMRITYVFDLEEDTVPPETTITDYVAPETSREVNKDGVLITIGLDSYAAPALAGPFTHEVLSHGTTALDFLHTLGTLPLQVRRSNDTFEFKTEATATAEVTVKGGYVRVVQIKGKSKGYPATDSTWIVSDIDKPLTIEKPATFTER